MHYINQKQIERTNRTREIIHELMECDSESEFNSVVETYRQDIIKLKLEHHVAGAIKRIKAVEINQSFTATKEKVTTCPNCKGEKAVAHKCTCGTLTTNPAYSRCGSCYRVIDWRSCPVCNGKGTIIINH